MIKGIAITTILLLTVGIIVSGLVIYQVYRSFTGSVLSEHECRTRMISWCTGCMNAGWSATAGLPMTSESSTCANKYFGAPPSNCDARAWCSGFIPIWGGNGGGTTSTTAPTTCADAGGFCTQQVWCEDPGLFNSYCICTDCYDCTTSPNTCCCD